MIVSSKIATKLFLDSCPEIFCTVMGASWKLFGASCRLLYLWYYLLSPQEAAKKFKAEIQEIISLLFWMKLSFHKNIMKLTDI